MNTLIITNQIGPLPAILKNRPGKIQFLALVESAESHRICDYLIKLPNAEELPRAKLFKQYGKSFLEKYANFMSGLNSKNHSLEWWAMPFTDKNALLRPGFREIAHFLLIVELAGTKAETLLIISDSVNLSIQARSWAKSADIRILTLVRQPWSWSRFLKRYTPAGVINVALWTFLTWILSRKFRANPQSGQSRLVIATLTHPRSFTEDNQYRDAYFGPLIDYLLESGQDPLILTQMIEHPQKQLRRIKSLSNGPSIIPVEACLTLPDLARCFYRALKYYWRPAGQLQGPTQINSLDISPLIRCTLADTCRSGNLFMSLRIYYAAKRLAQTIPIVRCIYPYENRSWEKMLMLGVRQTSANTQMVGFQHASVTNSHTNFMLTKDEAEITPSPEEIITTGPVVKNWLNSQGNHLSSTIITACALRQTNSGQFPIRWGVHRISRVLVALATNIEEYINVLYFLERSFPVGNGYEVRVRPHPAFSLDDALASMSLDHKEFFSPSTQSLADDLRWADVVLYASSTVGLEAISLGIPAIHLDLGELLDTDPIIGWNDFKWSVNEPANLISVIESIGEIPDDQFRELQRRGVEYSASYLRPVSSSALHKFGQATPNCAP